MKSFAVLAWDSNEGYIGIESQHDDYQDAVKRAAKLVREARRVFRRPYPGRYDHWFIPVVVEHFDKGYNGPMPTRRYKPMWD